MRGINHPGVGNDKRIRSRSVKLMKISLERGIFVCARHGIDRYVYFFFEGMCICTRLGYFLDGKVIGGGTHTENLTREVYRVRTEAHGSAQLFDTPCGRKELHIALGIQRITLFRSSEARLRYAIST